MTDTFKIYVIRSNTDRTEGRGMQVDREIYADEKHAIERLLTPACYREYGVMGTQSGLELIERVYREDGDYRYLVTETKIWGYRIDWNGKWGYGFMDARDTPTADPEHTEYLRLKDKFGG